MFVVVAATIVAFCSEIRTWTLVPVTASFGLGEVIVTTAGEVGREPAGLGATRPLPAGDPSAVDGPPAAGPLHAVTASEATSRAVHGTECLRWRDIVYLSS